LIALGKALLRLLITIWLTFAIVVVGVIMVAMVVHLF
jgi:hypothetical protein